MWLLNLWLVFPTSPTPPLRLSWGLNPARWNKRPILSSKECEAPPSRQLGGVSARGAEHEARRAEWIHVRSPQHLCVSGQKWGGGRRGQAGGGKDSPPDKSEERPHLVHRERNWFTPTDKLECVFSDLAGVLVFPLIFCLDLGRWKQLEPESNVALLVGFTYCRPGRKYTRRSRPLNTMANPHFSR